MYADDPTSLTCGVSTGSEYIGFPVLWRRFDSRTTLTEVLAWLNVPFPEMVPIDEIFDDATTTVASR
ncbi:MAG: hypothetical protein LZF62_40022 [Nitrospira sp.]|nr:MAG: hypothetical protein LZF62_40022 [Nitrospira sp.]